MALNACVSRCTVLAILGTRIAFFLFEVGSEPALVTAVLGTLIAVKGAVVADPKLQKVALCALEAHFFSIPDLVFLAKFVLHMDMTRDRFLAANSGLGFYSGFDKATQAQAKH